MRNRGMIWMLYGMKRSTRAEYMLAAVAENAHSGMTSARSISASVGIATYDSMLAWLIQCQYSYSMDYGYIVQLRCVNKYFNI